MTTVAEQTEGVRLGGLLAALQPDPRAVEDALTEILRAAADLPPGEDETVIASQVPRWEPVIAGIAAACQAGQEPPAELLEFLNELAGNPDWAALAAVLRRVLPGERGEPLLDGLDPIDTAIVRETLARLASDPARLITDIDEQWLPVISEIVAAASGQREVSADLGRRLDQLSATSDWSALVTVLRRIIAGERDPGRLTAGLRVIDATDSTIIEGVLAGLYGADSEQVRAWRAWRIAERAEQPTDEII